MPLLLGQSYNVPFNPPAAGPAVTSIWESWTCANHSTVFDCDSNWDETNMHGNLQISSNELVCEVPCAVGVTREGLVNETALDNDDMWVCGNLHLDEYDGLAFRLTDSDWNGGDGGPGYIVRVIGGDYLAVRYCADDPSSCSDVLQWSTAVSGASDGYMCVEITGSTDHTGGAPMTITVWDFGLGVPDTTRSSWDASATTVYCHCKTGTCDADCDVTDTTDHWASGSTSCSGGVCPIYTGTYVGIYSGGVNTNTQWKNFCASTTDHADNIASTCTGY